MQLTERRAEGLLRVYDVTVPAAELEARLAAKIEEVRPKVRVNGFRPGKVPASHIRKMYGPSMMQDIINEAVQAGAKESLAKADARPASEPALEVTSNLEQVAAGGADLTFELSVEIMPQFEPADPKTVQIVRPVADVAEDEVAAALEELRSAHQGFEDTEAAAAEGDALRIDFVGRIDGEPFEGGSGEDAQVRIGSDQFIPGFEEQLIGARAGETRTLNVTFPEDYPVERLKGKAASFETTVKAVRTPKAGEPDDAWAGELGFENLNALKEALRQRITAEHAGRSRAKAKRAMFDKLDAAHDFELPPRMVEAEFAEIWRQIEADRAAGRDDPDDKGKSEDELKTDYRAIAVRRVRLGLLLAEYGRRYNIEVSDAEVSQAILAQARRYPGQERQVLEAYQRNPNLSAQVRAPIYEEKVVDYLLELVAVTKETVSREELYRDDEGDSGEG